ncbi:hypothetical protein RHMOL_Rhmol04G0190200 [Rhododendron molle]|uniref:Uncharacterized protein n=1 Tax=Rhododendron molle TaxID=49168 RepID=A0ACC0P3B1_RHOML|nr:hypothetical protein RHMOL_Rhmol04G0190200 [Rhododendron molle]
MRGARTPEDQTSALLLGALLSGAGASDTGGLEVESEMQGAEDVEAEEEVMIEERITAAAEAKAYLARARPGFEAATYAPRLHLFEPTGMIGYAPARVDYPEDMLLRDRASHISSRWTTRTTDVYGHGGSATSLKYFKALSKRVRELVVEAGFGRFIQLLTSVRVDRAVLTALTERRWDTTNTFHLRFREMTVTPLDFAAITGLRVGGEPIPYDQSLVLEDEALRWFLGRVPRHSGGASLFPSRRSRVHLSYLGGLADLRQAGRFDWGGAALCTLYCFLGAASCGVGNTVGGYWRVVKLWAYEVLGMFPPENTCTNPSLLPRALAWSPEYRRSKERRGQVMTFQRWLDNITGVTVYWDRWAGLEADFLPRSREVTRSRVLLECPLGWQWYLGDRVTRQSLGSPKFIVPGPLPPRVQRTETYTRAELERYTVPDTNLERYLRRTLDYAAYRDRYLATSLGVEQELERRIAEAEARRARGETGGEASSQVSEAAEVSAPAGLPTLDWVIGVRDLSGARALLDIPRLPHRPMQLPSQVPREWAEQAIMLMVGMRHLLKDCAKGRALQTRPAPAPVPAVVPQRRHAREESEEDTEESLELRALGPTDSSTASGPSDDDDDDDDDGDEDEVESSESEGHQQKRTRWA